MSDATTGLIVPVDVAAFCVGTVDAVRGTGGFAGATTVYTSQVAGGEAFLGSNVTRSMTQPPWQQMLQGVHLHWALPDALTRSDASGATLRFAAAPNRWLLTRLVVQGGQASARSWIIVSDGLAEQPPAGRAPVTLPVTPVAAGGQNFRYVGTWLEFDPAWSSQPSPMEQLTGSKLNAVSSGVVSFAAYYPDCHSVFGFWDQLADVAVQAGTPAQLTYVVTGWHDQEGDDPLNGGVTLADLRRGLAWTFAGDGSATPAYALYSGTVQGIAWDPSTQYVYEQPLREPVAASAALGNNPAEALSAYFRNLDHPDAPLFEPLLNAFQMGLLTAFQQPTPNQLEQLYESLHENRFRTADAGTLYTVVKRTAGGDPGDDEVMDLPLPLADDLNLLNVYQQQLDLCNEHADEYRWRLFADWYRIFEADQDTQNDAIQVAYRRLAGWDAVSGACQRLGSQCAAQRAVVEGGLDAGLALKPLPAPRYYQPAEPVVLVEGPELAYPKRYGGDGEFDPSGYLVCRLAGSTLTGLRVNGKEIDASAFAAVALPTPNGLPHPEAFSALLQEACLLDTRVAAALSGAAEADLRTALGELLAGGEQTLYTVAGGQAPSPVAVSWWNGNPWLPVFLLWTVDFLPLQPTADATALYDYAPGFFTGNFSVDQDAGGVISYTPQGTPVDPSSAAFAQRYTGQALLQPSPAANFRTQLVEYLQTHTDATLQTILDQLESSNILVQPLSGFDDALLMREQALQLNVTVPAGSEYAELTTAIAAIVGDANHLGPEFNGWFNPVRAGWMKLSLQAVDAFGQKRDVRISSPMATAQTMTALDAKQSAVPSVAYLEPRLAQPARLLFRWLAADATGLEEMNAHPAASPVCGWLLPNHLDGSFFVYNQQGRPLGSLYLNGARTAVEWQSAPGDDRTIDQDVATVLRYENPQLLALAVALKNGSARFFQDFWRAVDTVHASIDPQGASSALSVLVGRPVAVAQASLRLEVEGAPALNQGWQCFSSGNSADAYPGTDNGFTGVQFPVVLGDLSQLDDGLVGYFRQGSDGALDLGTFYTEGASSGSTSGVVQPTPGNLLLTATPRPGDGDPPALAPCTRTVLMLLDPRGAVHATAGILPTKSISIPADVAADALSTLEMSFLVAPVLSGASGLAIPVPREPGYQFSWVEEDEGEGGGAEWAVNPEIQDATGQAVWAYSPQRITEGWLRMNPVLLEFALLDSAGHPVATRGAANAMTLTVVNRKPASVTFAAGQLAGEGSANTGSVFYLHFGDLVAQANVPGLRLAAPGWSFASLSSRRYGQYWAATPTRAVTLASGESLSIQVANLVVGATGSQAQVYFDYYDVEGVSDGVYAELLSVQSPGGA